MSYSSFSCFVCLTGPYKFVYLVLEQLKFGSLSTILSYWPLDVQHSTSWQRSLMIWELEMLLSTKMAWVIRSSVTAWNWVTVKWPGSYRGFPRWVSLGTGLARVDQRSLVIVLCVRCRSCFKKQTHECCQHSFRGCRSGRSGCRCSDHTSYTATSRFAWPLSQKEASSEAGSQKSLQTIFWTQPGQEHELLEPCPAVWWVYGKLVWLRRRPACVATPWWGVPRILCLVYSHAWWWYYHGLGLHEYCWYWGAAVHWGKHGFQHVLWHS